MRSYLPSTRFSHARDFLNAAFALAVVALAIGILAPEVALAGTGGGGGVDLGIEAALTTIRDYLQGPIVTIAGTISMIGILGMVIFRSQRGESITGLAAVAAALVVILNITSVFDLLGITAGASMAGGVHDSAEVASMVAQSGVFG